MKHIIFLLGILLGPALYGQEQRLGGFLTHLVAPLDKAQIKTNYRWEKGTNGVAFPPKPLTFPSKPWPLRT